MGELRRSRGIGASAGFARGPALAIQSADLPSLFEPDAILVAQVIHPYMAPLFLRAAGVVVEDGGLLQHAAILAREFGIPAVVGVADAVELFGRAALLEMDGGTGEVTMLEGA